MAGHPTEAPDALAGSPGGGGAGEARAAVRVMSGREWKPGDVVAGSVGGNDTTDAFLVIEVTANSRAAWGEGLHGVRADGNGYNVRDIKGPRPLVVIDPEDREQTDELSARTAAAECGDGMSPRDAMQAALRSLITPPRPPEPTGLGAVVEDEDGATYIRRATDWTDVPWVRADKPGFYGWAEITAVTVLSEGVQ